MPWQETSAMEQRLDFVREYQSELFTMTELAAQYGISRKTAYKWIARYEAEGALGMIDRSRRPHHHPNATDPEVMALLLAVRKRHPRWGANKLLVVAKRRHPRIDEWPGRSTVCDHLKAHQLVAPRRRRASGAPPPAPIAPIATVNEVWTTDFKGEFRTGDAAYCYPLTLRDGWSRFVLRCDALTSRSYEATVRCFEHAFRAFGLPERIRSDNGGPFASTGLGRLSRLSAWWIRLGVVPERIALGHPEQNGSHEQFHSVLKADTARPPAANAAAQQRRFSRFCREYNYERPHDALHDDVPANVYHSSPRPFPKRLPPLEYPGHLEIRRVSPSGVVSWRSEPLFLSEALAGEYVGFEEVDDGLWTIRFASVVLGRLTERDRRIQPIAPITGGAPPTTRASRLA